MQRDMRAGVGPREPKKRFGQHFLEPAWVEKVVRAIAPGSDEVFIEIGPGRGALTRPLAARAGHVVACEIDRDLAAALKAEAIPRVTVVEGDFLELTPARLRAALGEVPAVGRLRAAGNLPYNVGSPILFALVALHASGLPIVDATVMLQREVADRLVAPPGGRDYGVLSVLVGHRAGVQRLLALPAGAFRPAPKVQSALVRLAFHAPSPPVRDEAVLHALVKALFSRRRKTLANALKAYPLPGGAEPAALLGQVGLDGRRRPETLTLAELAALADAAAALVPTVHPGAVL